MMKHYKCVFNNALIFMKIHLIHIVHWPHKQCMDRDANDPEKLDTVLRWLKKKFSEYRIDERRKVH